MLPQLFNRNTLDVSVWVEVLWDKWLYARATHRLPQLFNTLDLALSQGTITDGLKRMLPFADNPQIPMDKNESEQNVRKRVIAQNNYFGSGSQGSAQLPGTMLTLMQTLLRWEINPRHWLFAFLTFYAENSGQVPEDLSPFPLWEMDEKRKQFLSRTRPTQSPDT